MRGGLRSAWFTWMYKGTVSKSGLRSALRFHGCFGKVVLNEQWSLIGMVFHQWLNCIGNVLVQKFMSSCMPVCEGLSLLFLSYDFVVTGRKPTTRLHTRRPILAYVWFLGVAQHCHALVLSQWFTVVFVFFIHTHTHTHKQQQQNKLPNKLGNTNHYHVPQHLCIYILFLTMLFKKLLYLMI